MNRLNRILLFPTGEEGVPGTPTPTSVTTNTSATVVKEFDPQVAIREAVAKHGDAERALGYFLRDNRKYRKDNSDLKAKLPPEGAVVLTADEAKAWDEYKALGKAGDLKAALGERDRLKDEADGLRRAEVYKQAAEAHGYKAPVLSRLASQEKLQIEIREEKVGAKTAQVAYVKGVDDKGKETATKLPDYAARAWPEFLDSLPISTRAAPGTPPRPGGPGPPPPIREQPKTLYASGNPF
jgi:hypothetical protein